MGHQALLCILLLSTSRLSEGAGDIPFPPRFIFGVATASYQIEGAWNESGKGESIWDRLTHAHPELIFDHQNGDVADDSYHQFKQDVALMADLGVDFYRFSLSWPRILPTGFSNQINEEGIKYYDNLIDELLKYNITPLITMYHWDLPQTLQDLGGWTNPLIADFFLDYAQVVFEHFGNRIKHWITFNEPDSICRDGYGVANGAPYHNASGIEDYMCGHNILRAHGMTYRFYRSVFQPSQKGKMGITISIPWMEPASTSPEDVEAAERAIQFNSGWFTHPIFSESGDYPSVMRSRIDAKSNKNRSRLPSFTTEEIKMIRGSADFLGLNHYTTYLASAHNLKPARVPSYEDDQGVRIFHKDSWPKSNSTWLRVVPWGMRKVLNFVKKNYNNPPVLISENGISLEPGLQDNKRINYIHDYLKNLLVAIYADKCRVLGYTYWSLMDNFEWLRGFSERFGLFEVDYNSPKRTRRARNSACYYKQLIRNRALPKHPNYYQYELDNEDGNCQIQEDTV